ncbi:MAG TPA: glycosyltransferase [Aeromicrobium sp.]|nr:glycosyltransferase [Aeromicrobium sp.]
MIPTVSVIIAVYNTFDYLSETLQSLEQQSIGFDSLEVILIDDGSTDGSDQIIDQFANKHPNNVVAIHQENSGTPSVPFNVGLDHATGRWVYFLGSDDLLAEDALAVLAEHGDEWDSDVIFGKMTALGDRKVPVGVYSQGRVRDLDLYSSRLPYAIANTKMFRRSMIEELGLRYRVDLRQRCDQPFTITAMVNARRISMIGDGAVYYARERADRSNVTYTAKAAEAYAATTAVMETIADCIEPGPRRDHVMKRQFDNTIVADLRDNLPLREETEREFVFDQIADLADRFLTENMLNSMRVGDRLVVLAAIERDEEKITSTLAAIGPDAGPVKLFATDDCFYLGFPGFDLSSAARTGYAITIDTPTRWISKLLRPAKLTVAGAKVELRGTVLVEGPVSFHGRLVPAPKKGKTKVFDQFPAGGQEVRADINSTTGTYLLEFDASALSPGSYQPSIVIEVAGHWYDIPIPYEAGPVALKADSIWRRRLGTARTDESGKFVLDRR